MTAPPVPTIHGLRAQEAWSPPVFRPRTLVARLRYPLRWASNWVCSNLHSGYGSLRVALFMASPRLRAGALAADHPWATGISPWTGEPVWTENVLYATPRKPRWSGPAPDEDEVIVARIGRFLTSMVQRSAVTDPEIPQGPRRRMPHAVNFIHGTVQFNGGFLLFNDFLDARYHFSDDAFVREVRRFARQERRELTVVMRERHHDPTEFAWFTAFLRARFPWWANPNGPTDKRVLWGTPSPYPAVNLINGSWILDMDRLRAGRMEELVRPPVPAGRYFQGSYRGDQPDYSFLERFHAWGEGLIIRAFRFQGGMMFTRRRRIDPRAWEKYLASGRRWRPGYRVPGPFAGPAPEGAETRDPGEAS
ncbi:MAG TPA: hypothetical protein VHG28_18480 [Longimicrobiaceae bacterium]|nr:hypothetical protein [Longimicrobiaceae bacterium]